MLNALLDRLDGSKTYLAALGLFGLALYQALIQRDYRSAYESPLQALGAAGLRHAIAKNGLGR